MEELAQAILRTIAYSDVFDHPLTAVEIQRYLIAMPAGLEAVRRTLAEVLLPGGWLAVQDCYYTLPGREGTLAVRRQRRQVSAELWPRAERYGRWIGRLPDVRMVAVTGSLAMDSADGQADLDYLVVTQPGRLWVTRAMVILLVRAARQRGDTLCPNYFLSEQALGLSERNLFTAHEFVQMTPLVGAEVYQKMWRLNGWVREYLPNAGGQAWETAPGGVYEGKIRPGLEALLHTGVVGGVERWEMRRKQARFGKVAPLHGEAMFGPDVCKGHFGDHGQRILATYRERVKAVEERVGVVV
jgi:hypothetical protein